MSWNKNKGVNPFSEKARVQKLLKQHVVRAVAQVNNSFCTLTSDCNSLVKDMNLGSVIIL